MAIEVERGQQALSTESDPGARTLCEAFQATVALGPDDVALRTVDASSQLTFGQYAEQVRQIAAGLAALGVGRGDTVALMMSNRIEFYPCDTAALHLGATPFSVYNTSSPEQIAYLFGNAGNRVVFAEAGFIERIRAAVQLGGIDPQVVCIDGEADGAITLSELIARGEQDSFDFEATWRAVQPDDVLTLIYTSGTTGPPKGVQTTHANMLAQCRAVGQVLPILRGDVITSYLPAAHVADRWASHYNQIVFGIQVVPVPDARQIAAALPAVRPTIWGAVPRVFEKLVAALQAKLPAPPDQLDPDTLAKIRAQIGLDRARWIIVGAAPMPSAVHEFLLSLGLPVTELYGMSETSCVVSVCPPEQARVGTVGKVIPGQELKVADDGELLIRGPIVMAGYRNDPERTAEVIDADGWRHSGDIVELDDDGHVRIVDRNKELIINAAGKNMSPANIEEKLKSASPLIGQAICIGDKRPYNVALLVLDPDAAAAYAQANALADASIEAVAADPGVQRAVADAVQQANEKLSRVEQIKRFTLLHEEWLPGGEELTPTMKLKRKPINAKYEAEIEALYGD